MRHTIAVDCLLIADDLTGACDAAVHFAMRGIRPAVVLVARGASAAGARMVAISTESRDLPADEIRRALVRRGGGVSSGLRGARLQEDRFHIAGQHGRGNRRRDGSVRLRCGRGVPGVSQTAPGGGERTSEGDERAGVYSHRCCRPPAASGRACVFARSAGRHCGDSLGRRAPGVGGGELRPRSGLHCGGHPADGAACFVGGVRGTGVGAGTGHRRSVRTAGGARAKRRGAVLHRIGSRRDARAAGGAAGRKTLPCYSIPRARRGNLLATRWRAAST